MEISKSILAQRFKSELGQLQKLYNDNAVFAEICRDYVELSELLVSDPAAEKLVIDSLKALDQEIEQHLQARAGSNA